MTAPMGTVAAAAEDARLLLDYAVSVGKDIDRPIAAYVLGHAVDQVAERWVMPGFLGRDRVLRAIADTSNYKAFRQHAIEQLAWSSLPGAQDKQLASEVRDLRNRALTLAAEEDKARVFRFMFLSLFMAGSVSALALVFMLWVLAIGLETPWPQIVGGVLIVLLLVWRSWDFYERAQRVPFSMVKMESGAHRQPVAPRHLAVGSQRGRVYLAGGFRTGWQDLVVSSVRDLSFIDPRSHGLPTSAEYVVWDLAGIRSADVVFACLEASNPGGYALALEVGYARALGKLVILVNEKKAQGDPSEARYYDMVGQASDLEFSSLDEGIHFLRTLRTVLQLSHTDNSQLDNTRDLSSAEHGSGTSPAPAPDAIRDNSPT